MTLYMGIVLYAPSLALSAVTGLNFTGSVISIGLVCTFYSTLGGMKAVLMTDVFQSILMFAAIFSVIGILYTYRSLKDVKANYSSHLYFQFVHVLMPMVFFQYWKQLGREGGSNSSMRLLTQQ